MPQITFLPMGITVFAEPGTLISDAARSAGLPIDLPCGGHGVCSRCMVKIISGSVSDAGMTIPKRMRAEGFVASCRARIPDSPLSILLNTGGDGRDGHFLSLSDDILSVERILMPSGAPQPMLKKLKLSVPAPAPGDGLSDYDRLSRAAKGVFPVSGIFMTPDALRDLPDALRKNAGTVWLHCRTDGDILRISSVTADDRPDCGLAVDLGTTTVAAHIVSLTDGSILISKTAYNAQISCGLDVISRIHYAQKRERLSELREKALDTIHSLISDMAEAAGILPEDITNVTLAGNTTMIHLLLGIVPEYIRLEPYTPALYSVPVWYACDVGLRVHERAAVYMAPSVGSYVGGDITAGLLCTRLSLFSDDDPQEDGVMLFIDIGTNGEIVLGNSDFLIGCACSAGPAFEGGGIRHGCRAHTGAIEHADIDEKTGKVTYTTIGGAAPCGICGSGIISLAAELFRKGFIDPSGKFTDKTPLIDFEGRRSFVVAFDDTGNPITISEIDIDNLIRAKAAVFSACQILMDSVGIEFSGLSKIYIAGGFGHFLNMEDAAAIGLLPFFDRHAAKDKKRVSFLGNSSLTGSYMALVSETHRNRLRELAVKITYFDLSTDSRYMDAYTAALFIPHTSVSFD